MKRTIGMSVCMMVLLAFCACGCLGDVNGVKTHSVPSEMYTQKEINAATDVVKARFKKDHGGYVYERRDDPDSNCPYDPHRTHVRKKAEIGNMPAAVIEHFGRLDTFGRGCF